LVLAWCGYIAVYRYFREVLNDKCGDETTFVDKADANVMMKGR
jgi:hypothetical protein